MQMFSVFQVNLSRYQACIVLRERLERVILFILEKLIILQAHVWGPRPNFKIKPREGAGERTHGASLEKLLLLLQSPRRLASLAVSFS